MSEPIAGTRTRAQWLSPFTAPVPAAVRPTLVGQQYRRLVAALPLLCLLLVANSIAMGVAVFGELPLWQQLAPPIIIVGACLAVLVATKRLPEDRPVHEAERYLRRAPLVAVPLGLVAGAWCINAFDETEQYYCMVAPVFIGIAALITATCLNAVPRAAIAAMLATVLPIAAKLMSYEYLGMHAMAWMLLLMSFMQARVVLGRFEETVQVLVAQTELAKLAESDPLTKLDNRLRYERTLTRLVEDETPFALILADLDRFKTINDQRGHLAGDAVLVEVAHRLRRAAPGALSVSRLGGDEFALLVPVEHESADDPDSIALAVCASLAEPVRFEGEAIALSCSLGCAIAPEDGRASRDLHRLADRRLYADKARLAEVPSPRRSMAQVA